jgi:hypothetical protein
MSAFISHHKEPCILFTLGNRHANVARMSPAPPRRRPRVRQRLLLLGLCAAIGTSIIGATAVTTASAHGRSVSYSNWEIDSTGATVSVRLKLLELSRLDLEALQRVRDPGQPEYELADLAALLFPAELLLFADGQVCPPLAQAERRPDDRAWVRVRWRVECPPGADSLVMRSAILLDVAPSHMHFARVRSVRDQELVRERVLTEASPQFELRRPSSGNPSEPDSTIATGSALADYIWLGVEHILSGWDHLAFVFGLLLLASRFGEVARLVTGFTLAHSLTLALAVQGLVHPRAAAVEAVIAFSVALVAIEKGWLMSQRHFLIPATVLAGLFCLGLTSVIGWASIPTLTIVGLALFTACYFALAKRSDNRWLRVCLTFAFGLVHGFGFAGVLIEMSLPTDRLVQALVGFNLGVELGQIGIVLLVWPLLAITARYAPRDTRRLAGELSAAGLCGLGLYWLAERAFSF